VRHFHYFIWKTSNLG